MKRFINLLLLFIFSFFILVNFIYAEDYMDACDHAKVYTDTYYNKTGWDVWVNVCDPVKTGTGFSACLETETEAKNWCKHEYRNQTYKGSYHTVVSGECSEQSICYCNTFSVTCSFTNPCIGWDLTKDVDGDGVYDSADGDVKDACNKWKYSSSSGSTTVTVDGAESGTCASADTKPSNDAAIAACKASYPNRVVKGASVGDITKTAYQVTYPMYRCKSKPYLVKNMREAKYYIKNHAGEEVDVYCVNPEHVAPDDKTGANEYPLEVTSCESSNSTPDCGWANIMIEGYYRRNIKNNEKYNYAVIGAAMRLWGAHVKAAGYNDTGIADEDDNTEPPSIDLTEEDDNGKWLKFVPDSKTGEFVNVFKETSRFMLENATVNGYRPYTESIYSIDASLDEPLSIKEITCNSKNMGLFCGAGVESPDYIYSLSLFVNTVQGNPNMQAHLDEILKKENPDYIASNEPTGATADILPGNKVQITYSLKRGVEIDCNTLDDNTANDLGCKLEQKITIKTITGEVITIADSYDYCKKNYCYITVQYDKGVITCDIAEKVNIELDTSTTCDNHTKKYVSCDSNPINPTQIMFGFDPNSQCDTIDDSSRIIETTFNCDACDDGAKAVVPNCDINGNEDYVERKVSDPSLNCILHKSSLTEEENQNGKRYYDYSDIFGVNTNICKVYCSDKVTYYMAPKEDVYSGLQLKYDIESSVFPTREESKKSTHALTSIINVERDCVSEIFYDNIPFDYNKNWEVAYGVSGEIHNWKDLYNAVYEEMERNQNNRKEVLNELIYDLYSCNFFSETELKKATKVNNKYIIEKPKNSKNAYVEAMHILENTKNYCNGEDCINGEIKYEGGAKYITTDDSYLYTGQNGKDPALSTEEKFFAGLNIRYCNQGECFKGSVNGKFDEDYDMADSVSESDKVKWNDSINLNVPSNDYAIFSYSMEADLYNSTRYQIEDYTGNVKVVSDDRYDDNLLTLDKYLYPVADSVKNICDSSLEKDKFVCDVNYKINISLITKYNRLPDFDKDDIGTLAFYRKFNNDDFQNILDRAANYSCVYTVTNVHDTGFIFRNIDLNNPVPVERNGTNWDSSGGDDYARYVGEVIQEIKNSGQDNLYANDYYLEYSYELTPNSINNIRSYNKVHTYYDKVIDGSCRTENNKKFDCKSQFMRDLHDDLNSFEIIVHKKDGKSQYTIDKENSLLGGSR